MDAALTHMLDLFGLTSEQRQAVVERTRNVAVTAGAGSGKTRTLVARYLGLLYEGAVPRQVVAITFTEKAAREMRSRVRKSLRDLVKKAKTPAETQAWTRLDGQMDSARIGTIHSLCAEILRSHPAEARLDPQFTVIEENQTAALRAVAVENALVWAIQQPEMEGLFRNLKLATVQRLLSLLLAKRLDVTPNSFDPAGMESRLCQALLDFLQDKMVVSLRTGELKPAGGPRDGMTDQAAELTASLEHAESEIARNNPTGAALTLFQARRGLMRLNIGARVSPTREAVRTLRERYDLLLGPWLGGTNAKDEPPDADIEARFIEISPLFGRLFGQTLTFYRAGLDSQNGLDFDDLEAGTVEILRNPAIRERWQQEVAAVLVDEFQDTNTRQREIIQGLCGDRAGRLFVVGDARQSIYRFRGADVTVFTGLQDQIRRQNGLALDLDRTFRAHPALLEATGSLLAPIMGTEIDPLQPFQIPYTPLRAERPWPRPKMQAPFVECILGAGEDSETGRQAAAHALAGRLLELQAGGEIASWDEVALLFRASTTFSIYEQALEDFGIPFVTVAGSGFYDRPEVRDLLNMLRSLADPWDDQALAGLLRSPAFGISDAGLYRLRFSGGELRSLHEALRGDLDLLSDTDREHARRALEIIEELETWVDRLPVAELLQRLVDRTDYRATLASGAHLPGSARLWRNIDKLISDAQTSGQVRVRAFLEYIATMRDVGAREGEAASEAEGSVRLMTIHKAKGLEFPLVVLADAGRRPFPGRDSAYRLGESWTFALDKLEASPLAFRLARWQDARQAAAEEQRLLYVAVTRSMEKLLISGHMRLKDGRPFVDGWMDNLLSSGGIVPEVLLESAGEWKRSPLRGGGEWGMWLTPAEGGRPPIEKDSSIAWPESQAEPIYARLPAVPPPEVATASRHRRLSMEPRTPPARVVGEMVHKALEYWRFPGDARFESLLRTQAQVEGVVDENLLQQAIHEAEALLRRFQQHPLYAEMNAALERHHELPYTAPTPQGSTEWGFIDCVYRTSTGWMLADFKTDELRSRQALEAAVEKYRPQMLHYRQAVERMVGETPGAVMVFLNVEGEIVVRNGTSP